MTEKEKNSISQGSEKGSLFKENFYIVRTRKSVIQTQETKRLSVQQNVLVNE